MIAAIYFTVVLLGLALEGKMSSFGFIVSYFGITYGL